MGDLKKPPLDGLALRPYFEVWKRERLNVQATAQDCLQKQLCRLDNRDTGHRVSP